jgi:molybdopterin-binding protein
MQLRFRHLPAFLLIALSFVQALQGQTLAIAAAANLKTALDVLKPAFEAQHPGATLQVSLGASGSFTAQIQQGAPFDVFLAADAEFPAKLAAAGFVMGESFPYATGRLMLWIRKDVGLNPAKEGLLCLEVGSALLYAPDPGGEFQQARICIRSEGVALERLDGGSASTRNHLPGRIVDLEIRGALARVRLDCSFPLEALVTTWACGDLGLSVGDHITALVKATAIRVVPIDGDS